MVEIFIMRLWLYSLVRKYGSASEVKFIQLLAQLSEESHKKILYWSKIMAVQAVLSSYMFVLLFVGVELIIADDLWHFLAGMFHFITYLIAAQISISDVLILYVYAFTDCTIVLGQMKQLSEAVNKYGRSTEPMMNIMIRYARLIVSIKQLNSLSKTLMMASKLCVIPFGSMIIIIATCSVEDPLQFVFKMAELGIGIFYASHGYILIAMLSRVDSMSKRLNDQINSAIVRAEHPNSANVKCYNLILEDLSCSRSHLVAREFGGRVTQMDAFDSVISTLSTLTLLFSLLGNNTHPETK